MTCEEMRALPEPKPTAPKPPPPLQAQQPARPALPAGVDKRGDSAPHSLPRMRGRVTRGPEFLELPEIRQGLGGGPGRPGLPGTARARPGLPGPPRPEPLRRQCATRGAGLLGGREEEPGGVHSATLASRRSEPKGPAPRRGWEAQGVVADTDMRARAHLGMQSVHPPTAQGHAWPHRAKPSSGFQRSRPVRKRGRTRGLAGSQQDEPLLGGTAAKDRGRLSAPTRRPAPPVPLVAWNTNACDQSCAQLCARAAARTQYHKTNAPDMCRGGVGSPANTQPGAGTPAPAPPAVDEGVIQVPETARAACPANSGLTRSLTVRPAT